MTAYACSKLIDKRIARSVKRSEQRARRRAKTEPFSKKLYYMRLAKKNRR